MLTGQMVLACCSALEHLLRGETNLCTCHTACVNHAGSRNVAALPALPAAAAAVNCEADPPWAPLAFPGWPCVICHSVNMCTQADSDSDEGRMARAGTGSR